jgi:hypothetical protein
MGWGSAGIITIWAQDGQNTATCAGDFRGRAALFDGELREISHHSTSAWTTSSHSPGTAFASWATIASRPTARAACVQALGLILILISCGLHFGAHVITLLLVQLPSAGQIGAIGAQRLHAARQKNRHSRTSGQQAANHCIFWS